MDPDQRRRASHATPAAHDHDGTGQKVVGIYHNATVLSEARDTSPKRHVLFQGGKVLIPYNVIAKARDVRFIPVDLRRFLVPSPGTPGAPGQSNASYVDADNEATRAFRHKLLRYIAARFDDVIAEDDNLKKLVVAGGQGTSLTAEDRAAVEHRAVEAAIKHLTARTKHGGWRLHGDYHPTGPFDLVFCKMGQSDLHVEVKGTTGRLASVIVTRNEVAHAQARKNFCALFVLSDVKLERIEGATTATGGTPRVVKPWRPKASELEALAYRYDVVGEE
jgi:hypothetical protein